MKIKRIELQNFRNLAHQRVELNPHKNYFIGENAQGKTNFLEAIFFLGSGKSFRPTETDSLIQFNSEKIKTAQIKGDFQHLNFDYHARALIQGTKKDFFLNNKKVYPRQLQTLIPMVLFSPESLAVIKESAEQRRKLLDELVLATDPRQAKIAAEFQRALRSRNVLLREIAKESLRDDQRLTLESLNQIYLVLATHMTQLRLRALQAIWADFENAVSLIFGKLKAKISFQYLISGEIANGWDEQKIFVAMQRRMAELQLSEYGAGHSLVGPQKHDIKFLLDENDTRFYCSQGQQRALILALKIAQIVYHQRVHQKYPILLLDDVLSELDENKRLNLMKFLGEISAQVLITATDLGSSEIPSAEKGEIFRVESGNIKSSQEKRKSNSDLDLI